MKLNILKDTNLQNKLNEQGYVVIDLLNTERIEYLNLIFNDLNKNIHQKGMVIGSLVGEKEYKQLVETKINDAVKDSLDNLLENYEIFSSSFVYKTPKSINDFPPHQDNSMLDENLYASLNIWIPLVDINMHNGPVYVLPSTHYKNIKTYRGPNINYIYLNNFETVYKYAKPIYIKKGQAIILNHSIIHYSTPNFTNKTRKAMVVAIKSINAPSLLYYYNKDISKIQIFEMDNNLKYSYDEFHYDKNNTPIGKITKELDYDNKIWSKQELEHTFTSLLKKETFLNNNIFLFKIRNIIRRKYIQILSFLLK